MKQRASVRIDQMGAANRWGKRLAPALSAPLALPAVARAVALLESYLAILQGKGAGSGWDIRSEAEAAAQSVRSARPTIVDVGANIGGWALAANSCLAPLRPRYLLVEPSSHCLPALHALPLVDMEVIHAAVGDHDGSVELLSEGPGRETASLYVRRDSFAQSEGASGRTWDVALRERVALRSLDSLAAERSIDHIHLLKIDVEGAEMEVLSGAHRLLDGGLIDAIAFEFGSAQINSRIFFHDLWDLLHPLGLQIFRIRPGGALLPVTAYYEDLEYFRGVSNYLALARSSDAMAR